MSIVLQTGERLLRKDAVSFVQGPLNVRPGVCYLTDARILAESNSLIAGALMAVSVIARTIGHKVTKPSLTEIPLRNLVRITQVRHGVNPHVLALSTGGEAELTIVFNKRQKEAWLQALEQALNRHGRSLQPEGEGVWRVTLLQA